MAELWWSYVDIDLHIFIFKVSHVSIVNGEFVLSSRLNVVLVT